MSATKKTQSVTRDEFDATVNALRDENAELKRQLDWFKRNLFGPKSEKRTEFNPHQLFLGEEYQRPEDMPDTRPKQKISYERGKGPKVRPDDCVTDSGLRFDASVRGAVLRTTRYQDKRVEGNTHRNHHQ